MNLRDHDSGKHLGGDDPVWSYVQTASIFIFLKKYIFFTSWQTVEEAFE